MEGPSSVNSDPEVLSHAELMDITTKMLIDTLQEDHILKDLPRGVTLEEVLAQIALEQGQSMTIYVVRDDAIEMPIVVNQNGATVLDLKRAIAKFMNLKLKRQKKNTKISWRYIWKTYWLYHESQKLKDDNALLTDYSIKNKSKVTFIKAIHDKNV